LQFCYKAREFNNCINLKEKKNPYQVHRVFIFTNAYQSVSDLARNCVSRSPIIFFARGSSPDLTEGKNLNFNFFFGAKKDLEDLSAYAGGVAE
jgi:hypothetical protein